MVIAGYSRLQMVIAAYSRFCMVIACYQWLQGQLHFQ